MQIGIIGAGKVGTTLGKYLKLHNISVVGYYSRTYESAVTAADYTKTKAYESLEALVNASDTLFITTPDGEISKVWDCIAKLGNKKIICHFSGSLSSNVFSGITDCGAVGASIHPMYAFSDKFTSYEQFHTAYLTMEGDEIALQSLKQLFGEQLGHKILTIRAENKMKYHVAAAMASNYMVALFETSLSLLRECGFTTEDSMALLNPLVKNNVHAMLEKGTEASLTGPVERCDIDTVKKHLETIKDSSTNVEKIYRSLGEKLVEIAKRKNQERDYSALESIMLRGSR